ncbi:MAG: hypothetical protein R2718_12470 [Solirubrobacterales bacterium]|nr:hypothetical protein [Solirubrobacterales bacterium]
MRSRIPETFEEKLGQLRKPCCFSTAAPDAEFLHRTYGLDMLYQAADLGYRIDEVPGAAPHLRRRVIGGIQDGCRLPPLRGRLR